MEILSQFGIDPYEYLGVTIESTSEEVKKAYKSKAKILHPDKTNGKTEAQFKLLVLSYKSVIKKCVDKKSATFEELKNTPREEKSYTRSFHSTNFDDPETRKEIFVDDDINIEEFEEAIKKAQGRSTSYSAENYYKKEVLDTMKTNGKFDKDKFNAFFMKLQKDGKIQNQLIRKEKVVACNADKEYVNVNSYDDMMIYSIDRSKGNYKKFLKENEVKNDDITELIDTDAKVLDSLIKEHKKNTGKISRKKLRDLQEKAKIDIPVNNQLTFAEAKQQMLMEQMNEIQDSRKNQKEYVMKNKRVFVNSISYD